MGGGSKNLVFDFTLLKTINAICLFLNINSTALTCHLDRAVPLMPSDYVQVETIGGGRMYDYNFPSLHLSDIFFSE